MTTRRWKVFKIYLQRFFTLLMSCFRKMRTRIRRLRRSFERGSCSGQSGAKRNDAGDNEDAAIAASARRQAEAASGNAAVILVAHGGATSVGTA